MIKIHNIVEDLVSSEEEALFALSQQFMNLSQYAKRIQREVGRRAKKPVGVPSIVVALSRIQKNVKRTHPLIQSVTIDTVTTKSPLSEIAFIKTPAILAKLSALYEQVHTSSADFLTMTLSTSEVTVICSDRIKSAVLKHFRAKPLLVLPNLAAIGLSLHPKYHALPNITFSLLRRIARKRIPLAETITTHREIIFVFDQKYLGEIVSLF